MYLYDDQKNLYNDIGMSNTKVLATLDKFFRILFLICEWLKFAFLFDLDF